MARPFRAAPLLAAAATALGLGACSHNPMATQATLSDRECMARVMYFESNRSSEDGMLAVGTVVMNRLQSAKYPKTICGVVAQENQFADGALSKPVSGSSWTRALRMADAVVEGDRHGQVGGALFFHTAGYTFPYRNMHYLAAAGGNVFYEKRAPGTFTPVPATAFADATPVVRPARPVRAAPILVAARDEEDEARAPAVRAEASPAPARPARPARVQVASVEDDEPAATPAPRPRPAGRAARPIREEEPAGRVAREPKREARIVVASLSPAPPRRQDGPPTIAELIELDMGKTRRTR